MTAYRRFPGTPSRVSICALMVSISLPALADTDKTWACNLAADGEGWQCSANHNSATVARLLPPTNYLQTLPAGLGSSPSSSPVVVPHSLDWVTLKQMTEEQKSQLQSQCRGAYIDPLADQDTDRPLDEFSIEASAARSEIAGNVARFDGGVIISQGYRQLSSESAVVDRGNKQAELSGNVVLREPGVLLLSDAARVNTESGQASLDNARFVVHDSHMRGGAGSVNRGQDGKLQLQGASLTYCPPDNENWFLQADTIDLDGASGIGIASKARLEVEGVPIVYIPWMRFPIDDRRMSGLLWPSIGTDSDGGIDIATPYYFNLAPNYDATLTPRFITHRGVGAELELRHLSHAAGSWSVGAAYLPSDDVYRKDRPDSDGDRWLSNIQQDGLLKDRWLTHIDYTRASDDRFFRDLDTTSLDTRRNTHLKQLGEVDYLGDDWLFGVRAQQFQTIQQQTLLTPLHNYKLLPQVHVQKRRRANPFEPDIIFNAEYVNFDHDTKLDGQRTFAELGVSYPMEWTSGFVKPTVKYRHLSYNLSDAVVGAEDETPNTGAALFSLDAGLFFERDLVFAGHELIQTLEPRGFYLYSEEKDQSDQPIFDTIQPAFSYARMFRDSRFSGHDRIDDANQVTVGLTTRFIEAGTGEELLTASIGQIYYFEDRLVTLRRPDPDFDRSNSEIAAELRYMPSSTWQMRSSILWDSKKGKVNDTNIAINYSPEGRGVYNLGYSYRRPGTTSLPLFDAEQLDFSAYWPVSDTWRLFTRMRYSLDHSKRIEDSAGFEYNSCCWRIRIMHSRSVDRDDTLTGLNQNFDIDHSTWIEFQLKGLGSIGNRVGKALEEMVWGYSENDY